jgi:hypothetical protein
MVLSAKGPLWGAFKINFGAWRKADSMLPEK